MTTKPTEPTRAVPSSDGGVRGVVGIQSATRLAAAPPKVRVLVIDDDWSVRQSLAKVLQSGGYDVICASDGREAMARTDPEKIDLLLLDIGLPDDNGWEIFEIFTHRNPSLPIIIITGQNDQFGAAEAAGVGALMEKPLDVLHLFRTMNELLAEPREARLRRLCGYRHDVHRIPPAPQMWARHTGDVRPNPGPW